MRSRLGSLRFIVNQEDAQTLAEISKARTRFAMIIATADTTKPQWSHHSNRAAGFVSYAPADNEKLEEAFRKGPPFAPLELQEGKYTVSIELLENGAYKMEQAGRAAAAAGSFPRISP